VAFYVIMAHIGYSLPGYGTGYNEFLETDPGTRLWLQITGERHSRSFAKLPRSVAEMYASLCQVSKGASLKYNGQLSRSQVAT